MPTTPKTGAHQIRDRNADAHRRIRRCARRHHQAAQRLDDGVHGLAGARRRLSAPKPEIEQYIDARIDRARANSIADAEPIRACPALKFSTTMSAWRTRSANTSRAPGCFRFSVTPYLPRSRFSADDRDVVRRRAAERDAVAPEVRWVLAAGIGRRGVLDLDDARAEAGQQERGERPGQRQREIEHREPGQRARLAVVAGVWLMRAVAGVYRVGGSQRLRLSSAGA